MRKVKLKHLYIYQEEIEKKLNRKFFHTCLDDWVFSSWRNHYHALLHGISPTKLRNLTVRGKACNF